MASNYKQGDYSKIHPAGVKEICDPRKSMDMPCHWCQHEGMMDCPKIRKTMPPDTWTKGKARKIPI
jgi:hypothetical protein